MCARRTLTKPASRWTLYGTSEACAKSALYIRTTPLERLCSKEFSMRAKHDAAPAGLGTFERNTLQISEGLKTVRKAKPDAVILVGPYAPVAAILKEAHASGWHPLFLTVSFVGTEGLIRAAGADAEGVVVTQVVPPYDRTDLPTIKLYRRALDKYMSGTTPTFVSL